MMKNQLQAIPDNEDKFIEDILQRYESDKFMPKKYDL